MSRLLSALVGSVAEAWSELRVHRTRVLLSLIGVGVAVTALTTVVAAGTIATQATTEMYERSGGRPASLYVMAHNPETGEQPDPAVVTAAFDAVMDRYSIDFATRESWGDLRLQLADGAARMSVQAVDVPYGDMRRIELERGRWFTERDELLMAPALVVNAELWQHLGAPDLRTHPTVTIIGATQNATGVIVGVTPSTGFGSGMQGFVLTSAYARLASPEQLAANVPNYTAWVPPELAAELRELIQRDIAGALGEGWQVDVHRNDYLGWQGEDPLWMLKAAVTGIAILVLLLGALGLVNIALVTVRHRIREIGIRRSFGATAGRVFFAVMMESVVATIVAGLVGVIAAILIVENPWSQDFISQGVTDVPPFPLEAAVVGLVAATAVGALAGLLPALVAVRVKVIDAIRY